MLFACSVSRLIAATIFVRFRLGRSFSGALLVAAVLAAGFFCPVLYARAAERDVVLPTLTIPRLKARATYTISEAVDVALHNFPTIRSARYKVHAAQAGVSLAKTAYLPNLDFVLQEMRVTNNVIAGTIMPQSTNLDAIPVQSGTVSHSSTFSSIWADNMAADINWLVYDFGLRHANVELAREDTRLAQANLNLTQLDVAFAAADAYLSAVAAYEVIAATQATLDRQRAAALTVHTLVDRGLRPGVDAARADYEVSQARIGLIRAERDSELAKVDLCERMGIAGSTADIVPDPLVRRPQRNYFFADTDFLQHPLTIVNTESVKTWSQKVHVLDRTWYPHLWYNSSIWGRGSGAKNQSPPVAGGIIPQVGNYMVGFSLSFPAMEIFAIKAKRKAAVNEELAQKANFDLAVQILEQKDARARVLLAQSRRIADETPNLVKAAKENEIKVLERYKMGLTNIVAVAEAEQILARAQVEDALAQVAVWHAILEMGYVQGNLRPFITLVAAAGGSVQ